jgi:hypothetical protein
MGRLGPSLEPTVSAAHLAAIDVLLNIIIVLYLAIEESG